MVRQLINLSTWQYNAYVLLLSPPSLPPCRDTAGQEKFRTITPKLYCGANVSWQLACDIREHVILICIVGGVVIRSRDIRGVAVCQLTTLPCEYTHDRVLF